MSRARPGRLGEFWLVLFIGIGLIAGTVVGLMWGLVAGLSLTRFWACVLIGMGAGLAVALIRNTRRT